MSSEPTPTRRPIAALRVSTVALLGIVAAVALPAGATALVVSGSFDGHHKQQDLGLAGPAITRVVVVNENGSIHVTGDAALIGVTGKADLNWHTMSHSGSPTITEQYADGVLTLTKDCDGGDCTADIDIHVPPTISLRATTTDAGITVTNISGGVDLHSTNAGISANKLGAGDASMHTTNGRIDASFAGGPKNIVAHTTNSPVVITTDGRTPYYDQVVTSNANENLDNHPERYADNLIDVQTSNSPVTIK